MNSENKRKSDKYTIIVGCGRLGSKLASMISENGENVLIIDKRSEAFRKLSPSFGGIELAGDATEIAVLTEAEIEKATAVVAVTNNDNTNIMVAQLAKELFHVSYVIARLYDPERDCVYKEFGISTVNPATLSSREIERLLGDYDTK